MIGVSLTQGVGVLVAVLGVYLWSVLSYGPAGADSVRALTFSTLVIGNLSLILVNRSWTHSVIGGLKYKNAALWIVTAGTLAAIALLFAFPATRGLFQFALPPLGDFLIAAAAGVLSVVWFEIYKAVRHRHHARVA
jgi:Ca2+-transporting ATPase